MAIAVGEVEQLGPVTPPRVRTAHEAGRERCAHCGRTPLIGEYVYVYEGHSRFSRPRQQLVCELCRLTRSDAPIASDTVRHCEHGLAVRRAASAL